MIIVDYASNGVANADNYSEKLALELYEKSKEYGESFQYTTSTDSLITAFRMHVAEKTIPHTDIKFTFNDIELPIREDGQFDCVYPKDYCQSEKEMLFRIIKVKINEEKRN